jgi:hypothetical protein
VAVQEFVDLVKRVIFVTADLDRLQIGQCFAEEDFNRTSLPVRYGNFA